MHRRQDKFSLQDIIPQRGQEPGVEAGTVCAQPSTFSPAIHPFIKAAARWVLMLPLV